MLELPLQYHPGGRYSRYNFFNLFDHPGDEKGNYKQGKIYNKNYDLE